MGPRGSGSCIVSACQSLVSRAYDRRSIEVGSVLACQLTHRSFSVFLYPFPSPLQIVCYKTLLYPTVLIQISGQEPVVSFLYLFLRVDKAHRTTAGCRISATTRTTVSRNAIAIQKLLNQSTTWNRCKYGYYSRENSRSYHLNHRFCRGCKACKRLTV